MATRTARDLIDAALQLLGVVSPEETPEAADTQNALEALQDILAEWNAYGWLVNVNVTEAITLIAGTSSYTVGTSGSPSLTSARPEKVIDAFVRDASGYDYPVVIIGETAYNSIRDKGNTTGRPDHLFVKYSAPNATLYVWPEPDAAESLYITSEKNLNEPSTLTENLVTTTYLPRNYFNALKWALACEIGPSYEKQPTPFMLARAVQSKAAVQALNAARMVEPVEMEFSMGQRWNILSGD